MLNNECKAEADSEQQAGMTAVDWHVRIMSGAMPRREIAVFESWLRQSPDNAKAYARLADLWDGMAPLAETDLVRAALQTAPTEQQGDSRRRRAFALSLPRFPMAGVAATALAVFVGAMAVITIQLPRDGREVYRTAVGEQKLIELADGSAIMLNTASTVAVGFSENERLVTLVNGQANFKVAKDAARPFIVATGEGTVRAIGTEFDIFKSSDRMTVTLIEGKVEVASALDLQLAAPANTAESAEVPSIIARTELVAGEQVAIVGAGDLSPVVEVDIGRVAAWREGKVSFRDTPLAEAVEEMNRYSDKKITLADPALSDLRVSGVFRVQNSGHFVRAVEALFDLEAQTGPRGGIVLEQAA